MSTHLVGWLQDSTAIIPTAPQALRVNRETINLDELTRTLDDTSVVDRHVRSTMWSHFSSKGFTMGMFIPSLTIFVCGCKTQPKAAGPHSLAFFSSLHHLPNCFRSQSALQCSTLRKYLITWQNSHLIHCQTGYRDYKYDRRR
jgi:hypothetical protein